MTLRKNIMPELTMERHYLFGCGPQAALRYSLQRTPVGLLSSSL